MEHLDTLPKVIGSKQTAKALQTNQVKVLYLAKDAEQKIVKSIEIKAQEEGIQIVKVPSMKELGRAFGIEVGAACAAILRN